MVLTIIAKTKTREEKEYLATIIGGMCLSFNSGYINGCCLSGFAGASPFKHGVAAFTGAYTTSGLGAGGGDTEMFGTPLSMIMCFIGGAFVSGLMNPAGRPWVLGPAYGPTFLVGSLCMVLAVVEAYADSDGRGLFYFAAIANGIQNGMSSTYSANLIRTTHLTGTSTDIGIILGQMCRGNFQHKLKFEVLLSLTMSFWLGAVAAYKAVHDLGFVALIASAVMFFGIGVAFVAFVVSANHVTIWQAISGHWDWDAALKVFNIAGAKTDEELMEVFKKFDDDGSGFIDEHELRAVFLSAGLQINKRALRRLMVQADENSDGKICADEWLKLVRNVSSRDLFQHQESMGSMATTTSDGGSDGNNEGAGSGVNVEDVTVTANGVDLRSGDVDVEVGEQKLSPLVERTVETNGALSPQAPQSAPTALSPLAAPGVSPLAPPRLSPLASRTPSPFDAPRTPPASSPRI
eukprot:GFYU01035256.1.p1 GENE.GFYU01035256.1~~GFYU01035256.1.p1  ORF type:complete len:463 (-),score=77.48 GFYU01035256.1:115-1503(-)